MEVVLVGLPGSGKSAVGRRLARRHAAELVDLDERIETAAGATIPEIFEREGEPGFRARERAVVEALGPAARSGPLTRVVATGGGCVVDPRNRWRLYRDRVAVWLDVRPEVAAQRLRTSAVPRPLVAGRDPVGTVRGLAAGRERFYAAAHRVEGVSQVTTVVERIEALVAEAGDAAGAGTGGALLLRGRTAIGEIVLGERVAGSALAATLGRLGATRAVVLTEPVAWGVAGGAIEPALAAAGLPVELVELPTGEGAKRLAVVEAVTRELARRRVERDDVLVAIGGGALGDTAGFVAATWLRGVRLVHLPTTLLAQVDSSIGGKTGVDLPEGKNLVGAFHQPEAVIVDVDLLRSLPERELRAALGEVAKMAVLGDERLFELLEREGERIAVGAVDAFASGAVAEAVERAAWAKVEVVTADERERTGVAGSTAGRITLNLGHSLGHAVEAAGGYETLRHGEAVGYGLRAAVGVGRALGVTPAARGERILGLLARLGLGQGSLGATDGGPALDADAIREALGADKKHAGGRLRWVLPTGTGVVVRDDVPSELVEAAIAELLAPAPRPASGGAR